VWAATSVTPGGVILSSTFEAVSVRAQFSGDDNGNATASIQFMKHSGDTGWHNAYDPFIDRRATLGGVVNPYVNEARASIVGLVANTTYDIRVTWNDPNGVSGAQPSVTSVTTVSYTPPTGGSTITVTDDASLASALSSVSPGQTIHLNPGTYRPFTIGRSGTSFAWIVIQGDPAGGSVVTGSAVSQNVLVNANYVVVQQLTLGASDANGIVLSSGVNHVFVQDSVIQGVSAKCAVDPNGHYGDTGILVGGGASNIFILRNIVHAPALNDVACTLTPTYNSPGTGIGWSNATTLVVKNNTVVDGFRDAISSDNSYDANENVDLTGNTVSGFKDDGVESKGWNLNVRLSANTIAADSGASCMAGNTNTETNRYGPLYIFRNRCNVTTANPSGTTAYKLGGAPTFLLHNSIDSSTAPYRWDTYVSVTAVVAMNNIAKSSGTMIDYAPATSVFDYNLGVVTSVTYYAYLFNGISYSSFLDFQRGTGQESHSLNVDPLFFDTTLRLGATSPAINKGVIIPNFNTLDSAWPYTGSAPDIGAFEFSQPPAAPTNLRIQSSER